MVYVKKFLFAPIFLLSFLFVLYQFSLFLRQTDYLFLNFDTLIKLLQISGFLLLASLSFVIFAALANEWKFSLPISTLASLLPVLTIPLPLAIIACLGVFVSLFFIQLALLGKLASYLTFSAPALLSPAVKNLCLLLAISLSLTYFVSIKQHIENNGFEIPESLISSITKSISPSPNPSLNILQEVPELSSEQLQLIQQNPELSQQYSLQKDIIEKYLELQKVQNKPPAIDPQINDYVKKQVDAFIQPYLPWIPLILALSLFSLVHFLNSIFSLLIPPLLWLIFYLFEKTKFIHFEVETREVKKLVV